MAPVVQQPGEEWLQASKNWDMERLLVALGAAKKTVKPSSKGLSKTEKKFLVLLLCGHGPEAIAQKLDRNPNGVRVDLSKGLYDYIEVLIGKRPTDWREIIIWLEQRGYKITQPPELAQPTKTFFYKRQDWGEALDVSIFYGRTEELSTLKQWILNDRCRLVALLGMGGIGKSSLSVKLAQQIQEHFDYVIWRSLRNAPPLNEILADLIQFLSNEQNTNLPKDLNCQISQLIERLRQHRCLVILDNLESILLGGESPLSPSGDSRTGYYQDGYEGYSDLIRRVGESPHQSCLMLTSREKPQELAALEGEMLPARSLQLRGVQEVDGLSILQATGLSLSSSSDQGRELINRCGYNPLALRIVSTTIRELYDGDISEFLAQELVVFDGIRVLLDEQFNRLSDLEKQIMYWLAIEREQVSTLELREQLIPPVTQPKFIEALKSLRQRSLIETVSASFTLQNVLMEYVSERLVQQVCQEIEWLMIEGSNQPANLQLFNSHALIKSTAKDYVREAQTRIILKEVVDRLVTKLGSKAVMASQLKQLLSRLQNNPTRGYAGGNIINLLCQMRIDLTDYNFSNLAIWQAYLQDASLQNVNFAGADLSKSVFAKTLGNHLTVAIGPDGKLATGDEDGKILLWQVADGTQLAACEGHSGWIRSVAFSPQGKTLASGSDDRTIRLWDVNAGESLNTWFGHTDRVNCICFSPDGRTLASGSDDQTVKLWNINSGQCIHTFQGHSERVHAVTFSPDSHRLASGSDDQTVRLWDISTGQCLQTFHSNTNWIWVIAFAQQSYPLAKPSEEESFDGHFIASSGENQVVSLWDINTGDCFRILRGHADSVSTVALSPDGQILASSSDDQIVKLWQVSTGECLKTLQGFDSPICSLAFSPDRQILAIGYAERMVQLWDVNTGQALRTLRGYRHQVRSFAVSPDSQTLATGSDTCIVKLWDVNTGRTFRTLQGHRDWVCSLAFSPDGCTLASGSDDRTVKLWNIPSGDCLKTLQSHTNSVQVVTFSPDGRTLASASDDQTVKLWDISTGQCLRTLLGHTQFVRAIAFSPDSQILASGSNDQRVKLWNLSTGECLNTLQGHTDRVPTLTFSPDGQTLASGSYDRTVKLWSVRTGQCLSNRQVNTERLHGVCYSIKGQLLVSSRDEQTVHLWDVDTGECLKTLSEHTRQVWSLHFSPNGRTLVSGSYDHAIKFWDIETGECLKSLKTDKPYDGMNITGVTGITESTIATLRILGAIEYS